MWLQWGVDNNVNIEYDGAVEGIVPVPDPAAEEEEAMEPAGEPEAPEYVDELVHPGGRFETMEDLTRYLREDPDCEHLVWQAVEIGEHDQRILCDLCAQHQHQYILQCRQCRLRVCFGCGRHRFG